MQTLALNKRRSQEAATDSHVHFTLTCFSNDSTVISLGKTAECVVGFTEESSLDQFLGGIENDEGLGSGINSISSLLISIDNIKNTTSGILKELEIYNAI